MACRLLRNPRVSEELEKRTFEIVQKTDVEVGEIIVALREIAFGDRATNTERLRVLDLLGKYKAMWVERQQTEDLTQQRELTAREQEEARRIAEIRLREYG